MTCAITSNDYGSYCVGAPELYIGDQYNYNLDVAVGNGFFVVLAEAFGSSLHGDGLVPFDDDPEVDDTFWVSVPEEDPFSAVTAGDRHVCAVSPATGVLVCLGDDDLGQVSIPP